MTNNNLIGSIPSELEFLSSSLGELDLATGNYLCPIVDYSTWAPITDFNSTFIPCYPCANPPAVCFNGGVCSGNANEMLTCTCKVGFNGTQCEGKRPLLTVINSESGSSLFLKSLLDSVPYCAGGAYDHAQYPDTSLENGAFGECHRGYKSINVQAHRTCLTTAQWTKKPKSRCLSESFFTFLLFIRSLAHSFLIINSSKVRP